MEKEELERKILEFNLIDTKIKELDQNLALLEKQINELQICQVSLDELKNTKKDTEMLSPLGSGIFTKTKLLDNSKVIIDIGAKILCKKNLDDAKKIIQNKLDQALDIREKLINEINVLIQKISEIEKGIRAQQTI